MHLSASAVTSSGFIPKTQVNNFIDYTPPKSNFRASTEISPDIFGQKSQQFSLTGQKYSPELESLRRDFNDQLRNLFYSLTGDVNLLKKDNTENKLQIDELRRELDIANAKILQNKNANTSELNHFKESVLHNKDTKETRLDDTVKGSWMRPDIRTNDSVFEIRDINEKLAQISRQISTINSDLDGIKKLNPVSKDQLNKTMGDFIDELERKLAIINERVRERVEEMDTNLVESLKDKEKDYNKLYYDIRSVQSSMIRVSDQVNTFVHSSEINLESQVKKIIHSYHGELKNLAAIASSAEQKLKMLKKDESVMLGSGIQYQPTQSKETTTKMKELDTIYQSIILLEKEMRSKVDMVDLNVNSVKRNLELELSLQLKNMVLPLQNNIEQYLQSSESRFAALEDAVLNHMKRESYVVPPERTSKLRSTMDFRDSHVTDGQVQYANRHDFENNSSNMENYRDRVEKKHTDAKSNLASGAKGKAKDRNLEALQVDEADSVISINHTLHSNMKAEGRYNHNQEKSDELSYQIESRRDFSQNDYDEEPEIEREEEEEEELATNIAKKILPDKDRNKKQSNAKNAFTSMEPVSLPDTIFRDFTSSSALKSHVELLHPGNKAQDRPSSSKKKKPEIDISDSNKQSSRETPKKSSNKTSPMNIDSKIVLESEVFSNDEEPSPIVKKTNTEVKDKKPVERGREPEISNSDEFQGGVKGLLSKARNKRENTPTLEDDDYRPRGKSAQKAKPAEDPRGSYGREQPIEDRFRRNPLPNKSFDRANSRDSDKFNQKPGLPPVDTKNMKNFNKGASLKPPQGKNKGMLNPKQNNFRGNNPNAWGMQDEEEDVEEIVYHVDEEGFLIDENGNYLVDEQGNFLQLSPEQLQEIEEKDLVYEKEF